MAYEQETEPRAAPDYLLGSHDEEIVRLGLQHRLWADVAHGLWRRAALRPGETVLDLGCGPGFAALDLLQWIGPSGRLVALDENPRFIERVAAWSGSAGATVDVHTGDVRELSAATGLAPDTVDFVYSRWVLCFVEGVERVVGELARVVKPGGRLAIQDYFNYECMTLGPRRPGFSTGIARIASAFRATGGDPDVMGRMPTLLAEAGFDVTHFEPIQRVAFPGSSMWEWPRTFWTSFLPRMVELGHMTAEERAAFLADWDDACADPSSFMHLPTVYELIAVKR
ncbi:MAG: methyltransferase domain-containing protein [Planctomycetota bacterium]